MDRQGTKHLAEAFKKAQAGVNLVDIARGARVSTKTLERIKNGEFDLDHTWKSRKRMYKPFIEGIVRIATFLKEEPNEWLALVEESPLDNRHIHRIVFPRQEAGVSGRHITVGEGYLEVRCEFNSAEEAVGILEGVIAIVKATCV